MERCPVGERRILGNRESGDLELMAGKTSGLSFAQVRVALDEEISVVGG